MIKKSLLDKIPLFKSFSDHQRAEVARLKGVVFLKFGPNEPILSEGDKGSSFFILLKGMAHVFKKPRAEDIATLRPGHLFGEVAFLSPRPRTSSIVAQDEIFLLKFERAILKQLSPETRGKLKDKLIEILILHLEATTAALNTPSDALGDLDEDQKTPAEEFAQAMVEKNAPPKEPERADVIYLGDDNFKIVHHGGHSATLINDDKHNKVEMVLLSAELPGKFLHAIKENKRDPEEYLYGKNYIIPKAAKRAWEAAYVSGSTEMIEKGRDAQHFQSLDNLYR